MAGNMLTKSKQVSIYIRPELLKKIDNFWHRFKLPNRNKAMLFLMEKGLEKVREERNGNGK